MNQALGQLAILLMAESFSTTPCSADIDRMNACDTLTDGSFYPPGYSQQHPVELPQTDQEYWLCRAAPTLR